MVAAKGSGRKEKKKEKKATTKLSQEEKLYLQGALDVLAFQGERDHAIKEAQAMFYSKYGREISRYAIYRLKKSTD
jgi:hypothetical protein